MKLADYWRVLEWQREYDEQEAAGTLPQLTLLRLAHDHFGDFDKAIDGVNTVETQMADNDYSLGLIVERISRGKAAGFDADLRHRGRRTERRGPCRRAAKPGVRGRTICPSECARFHALYDDQCPAHHRRRCSVWSRSA